MSITEITVSATEWARAHPTMFFNRDEVTLESIAEQLVTGARVLGATTVRRLSAGPWQTVAADEDWFLKARLPIPDDFRFSRLVSFPEQGQNCVRPEFLVAAFAEDVIVKAAHSEPIVLGAVSPTDELHAVLGRMAPWRRVIAFRGIKV
ncbi:MULTISPECIES: hypothetical protein [unclassified Variovorax]|jgi:hypothetical protein|uniref:hypothetical protein n=1 Tax=unclassified Variovorax TaxID=663243 RepID=UPI000F7DDB23|nr:MULTISPECIES: hypothetical protein [unclassified Variovorax]RSZ43905.1 hypothetical protein EJO70_08140 [Variovorax sp. 553]RSZ45441.1 hypothetical protein EJO71_09705 [Variovorax sp. 679]